MQTFKRAAKQWGKDAAETSKRYQAAEGGQLAVCATKAKDCLPAEASFTAGRAAVLARASGCYTTYAMKAATSIKYEKASSISGATRDNSKNPGSPLLLKETHGQVAPVIDATKKVSVPIAPRLPADADAFLERGDASEIANVACEVVVEAVADMRDFQAKVVLAGAQSTIATGCSCDDAASADGSASRLSGAVPDETAKLIGLQKARPSQSELLTPGNIFEEQSPSTPWISAADGKIAFYSQRKQETFSFDPAVVCIVLLIPLLAGRSNLTESISNWDDDGRVWHLQPVALPFWSWLFLFISMAVPSLRAFWSCVPLATPTTESSASFVLYGLLDAVSSLLLFCNHAQRTPIPIRMALGSTELVFVEIFAGRLKHKSFKCTRTLSIVAAFVLLSFLTASTGEDDEDDLYGQMLSPIMHMPSVRAGASLVGAAACRAARLTLGANMLEPRPQVDDYKNTLKVVTPAGLSGSFLVLMVAIICEGLPPCPTASNAALGIVLLFIAPVSIVTEMITLQRLPVMTVAAFNVSHPFLSIFTTAIFSDGVLTSGQISALILVLVGASFYFGYDFVAKRKAILQLSG